MSVPATSLRALTALVALVAAACGDRSTPTQTAAQDSAPRTLAIAPQRGAPGSTVTLTAQGLPPSGEVGVGYGPPNSEYEIVKRERALPDGTLTTLVTVPEWAEAGSELIFAVAITGSDAELLSQPFVIEAREP